METKIINQDWKSFKFKDVFSFRRGQRLITLDQVNGDIPYISSSKNNNGIDNYILPPEFMVIHENAITLNNSGSVGYCFYHPYKFVASDHCTVIYIREKSVKMNVYVALFLKPIIEAFKVKYNFAREISDERLAKEEILLPVKNEIPDWDYMESFIQNFSKSINYSRKIITPRYSKLKIDLWKPFLISTLFKIKKGKRLTKEEFSEGDTPFIGAIAFNNGYREFIGQEAIHNGNTITVNYNGSVAEAFYQPEPFWASDDVNVLYPKFQLNQFSALFICSIIKMEKFRFNYGRKWNLDRMNSTEIYLPANANGEPDYNYMEHYIKSLNYSSLIS